MNVFNVLVVDDETQIQSLFQRALAGMRYRVTCAGDVDTARQLLQNSVFQAALIDLILPDASGLELLQHIKSVQPNCRCIIMTGFGTTKTAVRAIRLGAYDYIEKPFNSLAGVLKLLQQALESNNKAGETNEFEKISKLAARVGLVVGESNEMRQLAGAAYKIADKGVNVLITGETGTGKELLARFIHASSGRSEQTFIPVNCGAFHENLLESELFGHEKGSFTGAAGSRKGIFELADQGTLFLDELAEAGHSVQVKLLRVLETGRFTRLGGEKSIATDTRIIAATNADIESLVRDKVFREDLFYRLDVVRLELPPLRRRIEDIPTLTRHFAAAITGSDRGKRPPEFSKRVMEVLMTYPWYGNIRELYNVIQQVLAQNVGETIELKHLPPKLINHDIIGTVPETKNELLPATSPPPAHSLFHPRSMDEVEREHIENTIKYFKGNVTLASKALGLSRATIYRKIKQ